MPPIPPLIKTAKVGLPPTPKTNRGYLLQIVLLAVVGGLGYFFLLSPKLSELDQFQKQNDQVSSQLNQVTQDSKTLQSLSDQLNQHKDELALLDEAMPLDEWQLRTQRLVEAILSKSGVIVANLSVTANPSAVVSGDLDLLKDKYAITRSAVPVSVDISLSGTFDQLYDAVKRLENYGRLMDISTISMGTGDLGLLNMRLSVTTYYFGTK